MYVDSFAIEIALCTSLQSVEKMLFAIGLKIDIIPAVEQNIASDDT